MIYFKVALATVIFSRVKITLFSHVKIYHVFVQKLTWLISLVFIIIKT